MEHLGIDPNASRLLSERSTIWARAPYNWKTLYFVNFGSLEFWTQSENINFQQKK